MRSKRIIEAKDIVRDIRSGMSDTQLMTKYDLSSKGLQSAFQKLVDNRIMTVQEVYGERYAESGEDTIVICDMRQLPRYLLTIIVPLYDGAQPENKGVLRDISEKGLGITGLRARIGEIKSLVIVCGELFDFSHIWIEAECRWINLEESEDRWEAGFQITKISREDLAKLKRLIGTLTLDIRSTSADEDLR